MKDLYRFDGLQKEVDVLHKRIENFKIILEEQDRIMQTQWELIKNKDEQLSNYEKILNLKKSLEFHTYLGVQFYNLKVQEPQFYVSGLLEAKKFNIGGVIELWPVPQFENQNTMNYSLLFEYKLF